MLAVQLSLLIVSTTSASDVILQRDKIAVTVDDVERYIIENTPENDRSAILNRDRIFLEIVENIYVIRSLAAEAESDKSLDWAQLNWANELQGQRKIMSALLNKEVENSLTKVDWDAIAKEKYLVEGDKFKTAERVHASHLLIKTGDNNHSEEEALKLINEVRQRALDGEDFAELAKSLSEDPSAKRNSGDLGFFTRGQMVKAFEDAAFSMTELGHISEVITTEFGYHIIQFHEYQPAGKTSFEDVKQQIIAEQQQKLSNQIRQNKILDLKSATDIELDVELMEQLRIKYKHKVSKSNVAE